MYQGRPGVLSLVPNGGTAGPGGGPYDVGAGIETPIPPCVVAP